MTKVFGIATVLISWVSNDCICPGNREKSRDDLLCPVLVGPDCVVDLGIRMAAAPSDLLGKSQPLPVRRFCVKRSRLLWPCPAYRPKTVDG